MKMAEMKREERAQYANALALYRRVLGVSQSDFEAVSGVSRSSMRQYETTGHISDQMLDSILKRLECSRSELLDWARATTAFARKPQGDT
jgi:transcriptional regulator with XRE-family HTH domain